jgi:hypothetical protein
VIWNTKLHQIAKAGFLPLLRNAALEKRGALQESKKNFN